MHAKPNLRKPYVRLPNGCAFFIYTIHKNYSYLDAGPSLWGKLSVSGKASASACYVSIAPQAKLYVTLRFLFNSKYVRYEKKFVKKHACMVKNPFTGRMQFLVPINGNQTKAINVEQFYMGLY